MKKKNISINQEPNLFDVYNNNEMKPLEGHQAAILGRTPQYSFKELSDIFSSLGAKVTNAPSKNVSMLFILNELTKKNEELIETLKFNGYEFPVLGVEDINSIIAGNYDKYINLKQPEKNLSLTPSHLSRLLTQLKFESSEGIDNPNPLYRHTLFFAPSISHHLQPISQVFGNLGILLSGNEIDEETDIIVLPDETIENLSRGLKDENVSFIEKSYNKSSQVNFNFHFMRFGDIISFIENRIKSDECTKSCYELYKFTIKNQ